jgi:hypothetical protein
MGERDNTGSGSYSTPVAPLHANETAVICPFHVEMLENYQETIASYILIGLTLSVKGEPVVVAGFSLLSPMTVSSVTPRRAFEGVSSRLSFTGDYFRQVPALLFCYCCWCCYIIIVMMTFFVKTIFVVIIMIIIVFNIIIMLYMLLLLYAHRFQIYSV